jgi:hypothetical protein
MARTLVSNIVTLARDQGTAQGAPNTPHTGAGAGDYIASGSIQSSDLRKILLQVQFGTTAGTLTVRAPGNGVNVAGNAQVSPYPANAVFAQGAVGDLNVAWGTTAGTIIVGPFTTDRFEQPDGNMYLDWSTVSGPVVFWVYQTPFVQV